MRITRHETVIQISFMPRLFPVNCYLVEEDDGLTLIDAAMPFSWRGILQAAANIGKPIKRIALTHVHSDHIGALDRLKASLPNHVPVYVSARDARLMEGDTSLDESEPNEPIRGGFDRKIQTRASHHIADGEHLGSLLVLATPGHTPGHMSFYDERHGILIAGDAFQTRGGLAVAGQLRPTFPFPAWATWSRQQAIASANKLLALKPSLLAVGHGRMIIDPQQAMMNVIQVAEAR